MKFGKLLYFILVCGCIFLQLHLSCFAYTKKPPKIKQISDKSLYPPQTKAEYIMKAQDIPSEEREILEAKKPKSDKNQYIPELRYIFEKYNYPQGSKKLNLDEIKKNLEVNPIIIADPLCHRVAYVRYYYAPDIDQISSNFYVGELDTAKTKTERILAYRHEQQDRTPIIEAGTKELYRNYFRGLSVIDWSTDSKKVLLKELSGSTIGGIYKSDIYVYFTDENEVLKLDDFTDRLKKYYLYTKKINITNYRHEFNPIGFSSENEDIIVIYFYLFDKKGRRIFMGTWGYNLFDGEIIMLSSTNPVVTVSANGIILKQVLN